MLPFRAEPVVLNESERQQQDLGSHNEPCRQRLRPADLFQLPATYSSWLNQVELWFSQLQRDVIARGSFTSTADLARQLRRYINAYSKAAKPINWKYSNPKRRIRYQETSSETLR